MSTHIETYRLGGGRFGAEVISTDTGRVLRRISNKASETSARRAACKWIEKRRHHNDQANAATSEANA